MIDFVHFTPWLSLAGGLLIGVAAATLLLFNGRIAGISGILGSILKFPLEDVRWRVAFLGGILSAPLLLNFAGYPLKTEIHADWGTILVAGFLVGIGTRYASGCTSGHGVCGISRGSRRSIIATIVFMFAGFSTVFVQRHIIGG